MSDKHPDFDEWARDALAVGDYEREVSVKLSQAWALGRNTRGGYAARWKALAKHLRQYDVDLRKVNAEVVDTCNSLRAERDAARAHADKALESEAKWRAEARTLRTCLDAELAVQDQQDEGLVDQIENLEAEVLEARNEAAVVRRAYLHEVSRANDAGSALSEAISRCGDDAVYEDLHARFGHLIPPSPHAYKGPAEAMCSGKALCPQCGGSRKFAAWDAVCQVCKGSP